MKWFCSSYLEWYGFFVWRLARPTPTWSGVTSCQRCPSSVFFFFSNQVLLRRRQKSEWLLIFWTPASHFFYTKKKSQTLFQATVNKQRKKEGQCGRRQEHKANGAWEGKESAKLCAVVVVVAAVVGGKAERVEAKRRRGEGGEKVSSFFVALLLLPNSNLHSSFQRPTRLPCFYLTPALKAVDPNDLS